MAFSTRCITPGSLGAPKKSQQEHPQQNHHLVPERVSILFWQVLVHQWPLCFLSKPPKQFHTLPVWISTTEAIKLNRYLLSDFQRRPNLPLESYLASPSSQSYSKCSLQCLQFQMMQLTNWETSTTLLKGWNTPEEPQEQHCQHFTKLKCKV